jgi:hypothetical protein
MNNWKLRHSFTGNATSDVQTVNGYLASGEDNDFAVTVVPDGKEYAAPLFISAPSAFGRVQNQLPGICNGTHTHTGAASGSGIAATTITGSGSGATFAYDFDTLGVLTTLTADGAGSGYKVGDKLSIDTTEGHTIEFRLVEGSNAATVSVSMDATRPNKPIPFPVSKMRVEGLTDRTVLFLDKRSRYVFPKPTPYLLDTYEGAAAAYSLRRLRSAYTGPAVRVRRASNNDELDIYFNRDGSFDTATLEAFCAGTDGFVKVWYDQGQEGNDMSQTTTADQFRIVLAGVVSTLNGQPTLNSPFGIRYLESTADTDYSSGLFTAAVFNGRTYPLSVQSDNDTGFRQHVLPDSMRGRFDNTNVADSSFTTYNDDQGLQILTFDGSTGGNYINDNTGVTASVSVSDTSAMTKTIGSLGWSEQAYIGNIQEVIMFDSDQSANREAIRDNINEHYSIY